MQIRQSQRKCWIYLCNWCGDRCRLPLRHQHHEDQQRITPLCRSLRAVTANRRGIPRRFWKSDDGPPRRLWPISNMRVHRTSMLLQVTNRELRGGRSKPLWRREGRTRDRTWDTELWCLRPMRRHQPGHHQTEIGGRLRWCRRQFEFLAANA
jgi:hypothetical protein